MLENDKTDSFNDDDETFQELMEQPGSRHPGNEHPRVPPMHIAPRPKSRVLTGAPPTSDETMDKFMRSGLQRREMQRLKQGKFHIGDSARIDLHGLKRDEAHQMLHEFLDHCLTRGTRYVSVICGKGIHSPTQKPVLKFAIRSWLVEHRKVLAYCPAQLRDGGSGALYVLLKTGRATR